MATSRMAVRTPFSIGMPNGVTNTHIRRQIRRLRLSKGWSKQDLEQASGIAADSLMDLEAGICHINVDALRKIIEALESDITEVWPTHERASNVPPSPATGVANDPLYFSRLAEVHSLTGAEASCLFSGNDSPLLTQPATEETPKPALRALCTINLGENEKRWLSHKLLQGNAIGPWATYRYYENGRSLYLCLKNAHLGFWAEAFIERCLAAWLAAPSTFSW